MMKFRTSEIDVENVQLLFGFFFPGLQIKK